MPENSLTVPTNPARALRELSRQPQPVASLPIGEPMPAAEEAMPDGVAPADVNNTTILQKDKPTDKQTDQQTSPQTDNPANQQSDTPTIRPTSKQAVKRTNKPPAPVSPPETEEEQRPTRVDGRTLRVRQETADRTMVTSMRLAVPTIEALDEYCWRHRQRKQDVVQAALDMYFAASELTE